MLEAQAAENDMIEAQATQQADCTITNEVIV